MSFIGAVELGALMTRRQGALSCLVFVTESTATHDLLNRMVRRSTRATDVIGPLNATMLAVFAPGTAQTGAVQLARRLIGALPAWARAEGSEASVAIVQVGYETVGNLRHSPIDAAELLARATAAVRDGTPEPSYAWLRRYATNVLAGAL